MEKPFPPISQELLTALSRVFPDQVPNLSDTDRQVWTKVGNVQVVRFLRERFREQNEDILNTKVIPDVHV